MPGYQWVNISWGLDIIDYFIYSNFGFLGLMIAGALVITATFFFFSRAFRLTALEQTIIFPVLIFLEKILINQSLKGQEVSILFIAIQTYLLEKYFEKNIKRLTFFLIFLYLTWASLHTQFLLGFCILLIYLTTKFISTDYIERSQKLISIILISFLVFVVTLINPFGIGIYTEVMAVLSSPNIKLIQEFKPIYFAPTLFTDYILTTIIMLIPLAIIYVSKTFKKNLPYIAITGVLYSAAFFVNRYALSLFYFTIPFLKIAINFYAPQILKKNCW